LFLVLIRAYLCVQITGGALAGSLPQPHPPSERPVTPRTPRSARQSTARARASVTESAVAADDVFESPARNDTAVAAAARAQPQKRSPSTNVYDGDDVVPEGHDVARVQENRTALKRRRSSNMEVGYYCMD